VDRQNLSVYYANIGGSAESFRRSSDMYGEMKEVSLDTFCTALASPLMEPRPKKLLDQMRDTIRLKHYAYRTEETYVQWI